MLRTIFVCAFIFGLCAAVPVLKIDQSDRKIQRLSNQNAARLQSGDYKQNPEELSGQFEGDIILTETQHSVLVDRDQTRTGLINLQRRWPNKTVPYEFQPDTFTPEQISHIDASLAILSAATSCVSIVRRTTEVDYVEVTGADTGCHSNVGYLGRGRQQVNFQLFPPGEGCHRSGTIIHEFLHTLGFYHMQSATERDDWVNIIWNNIESGKENNFNQYPATTITNFGVDYDVTSVMHYSAYAFSKNDYATIVPNDFANMNVIGQRGTLTDQDILRLKIMYECE